MIGKLFNHKGIIIPNFFFQVLAPEQREVDNNRV
jgi:hypothetical protein